MQNKMLDRIVADERSATNKSLIVVMKIGYKIFMYPGTARWMMLLLHPASPKLCEDMVVHSIILKLCSAFFVQICYHFKVILLIFLMMTRNKKGRQKCQPFTY